MIRKLPSGRYRLYSRSKAPGTGKRRNPGTFATRAADLLVALVALLHLGFLVLEMFLWDTPTGHRIFAMTPEVAASSAVLAMNQGLYNGFLAAGLAWGLVADRRDLKLFFLGCVIVAGIFGAATAKPSIFFMQALPAIVALGLMLLSARGAGAASD